MAADILKLKKQATSLGMDRAAAIKANRKQLEDFIAAQSEGRGNGTKSKKAATKAVKKTVAKKAAKKAKVKPVTAKKTKAEKPKVKKTASKTKAPAAKSAKTGKAKRPSKTDPDVGRAAIGSIDWTIESDEWNPRAGGPTERMFKALKKSKGNVDKAFDLLKGNIWDFVGKKMRDGTKRDKASAEAMLRYRLNRTKFEFATRTGQHEIATNRVEYGTGDRAAESKKAKRKPSAAKANKPKTQKAATGKKRGRPAGSKNNKNKKTAKRK